jgi:hypothetical protein
MAISPHSVAFNRDDPLPPLYGDVAASRFLLDLPPKRIETVWFADMRSGGRGQPG